MYLLCLCQKTHEPACRQRHKKEVNIDSDDEYFDPNGYSAKFGPSHIPGDWRGTHEELLRHIRRQRRAAKAKKREEELKSDLGVYWTTLRNLKRSLHDFFSTHKISLVLFCQSLTFNFFYKIFFFIKFDLN